MFNNKMKGFTLVELLAVIFILGLVIIIAVPKVFNTLNNSKKRTLELTALSIIKAAEEKKLENEAYGLSEEITCESISNITSGDFSSCEIKFNEEGNALVTIAGKGRYKGLYVCDGTKVDAKAQTEKCGSNNMVINHPLFLQGQALTPDKFEISVINEDGSTRILEDGTRLVVDDTFEATTITSPNWPNNYNNNMTESDNYWEKTYESADMIQITFDETSELESINFDFIAIYDKEGNQVYKFAETSFSGKTYTVTGDYIKVTMKSDSSVNKKGFSAEIKPLKIVAAEYTVSPAVAPNTDGNFDITVTLKEQNITKKIITKTVHEVDEYVASHKGLDTVQTNAEYNGTIYDAGIRYTGLMSDVKNKVYYNCDDTDVNGVSYGEGNYNYAQACEIWRIIGVFDVSNGTKTEKRVKLINTASTFTASWDSSASAINQGNGINQWGESGSYNGADLMQLLNGYYISAPESTCTYCSGSNQSTCSQTCTRESLKSANMKVLTSTAKAMIDESVWDTYGVMWPEDGVTDSNFASDAYLQEKGISAQYTGKICTSGDSCNDGVTRTTSWTGLVGLMSVSDIIFANGWLYNQSDNSVYPWSISPIAGSDFASSVWNARDAGASNGGYVLYQRGVFASVYLKSDIMIIGGDGYTKPYKLSV